MKILCVAWSVFCMVMTAGFATAHGDLHGRISEITAQLREAPSAGLFFKRGCLYLTHGDAAEALDDFRQTDAMAPGAFETGMPRAEAHMILGNNDAALQSLNRCLERDPSASRCLVLRARVWSRLGKQDAAAHDYRKALSSVSRPEPDMVLEVSAALAEIKQPAAALQALDEAIARLGPLVSLVNSAIEIDMENGNADGALRRIDMMRDAAPRPEPWMARRASVLARAGRTAESQAAWQSLLDHLSSLPAGERSSHAMFARAREARDALAALESNTP